MVISRKWFIGICTTVGVTAGAIGAVATAWPHVEPGTPVLWYQYRPRETSMRQEFLKREEDMRKEFLTREEKLRGEHQAALQKSQTTLNELLQWKFEGQIQTSSNELTTTKIELEKNRDQSPVVKALLQAKIAELDRVIKETEDKLSYLRLRK